VPASATRPGFGLAAKIFAASTLVVVAVLTASFGLTSLQANRTADEAVRRALDRTRRSVQAQLQARERAIAGISAASAAIPTFRDRILESEELSDRLDQADEYRDLVGATWALVTDDQGSLLARTDRPDPDEVGRDLSGGAQIADPLVGEPATGAWLEGAVPDSIRLFLAVGTPLADPGAAPRGVLVAAFELNDSLAAEFSASFDSIDIAFFALDQEGQPVVVGSTLPRGELTPVLAATLDTAALAADTLVSAISAELGGRHLLGLTGPIRSAAGDVFGGFVAFRARETELGAFQALRRTMGIAVIVGVLLALVSAALLGRQIASPVRHLVAATHQVQDGDYEVEIPSGKGRDWRTGAGLQGAGGGSQGEAGPRRVHDERDRRRRDPAPRCRPHRDPRGGAGPPVGRLGRRRAEAGLGVRRPLRGQGGPGRGRDGRGVSRPRPRAG
jgi:methyl-accepting chemotaxis protein